MAVLGDSSSSDQLRKNAESALLTALGGGYEPEMRLGVARALIDEVDEALYSLLAKHLEDIRTEAEELGKDNIVKETKRLLERLEQSKE